MKFSHNVSILIVASIYAVVTGASATWFVTDIRHSGGIVEEQTAQIANVLAQETVEQELLTLVERTKDMRASLNGYMLTESEVIDVLSEIESIGRSQGIKIETTSLSPGQGDSQGFDSVTMSFKLVGTKDRVLRMVAILENIPYHSIPQSVVYDTDKETGEVTANITLVVSLLTS